MDKEYIAALKTIIARDDSTVYTNTPSEEDLRNEYQHQYDTLSVYADTTSFNDQNLALHAKTLLAALKASLEIKNQLVTGAPLERADLNAVVAVNDAKREIADKYL